MRLFRFAEESPRVDSHVDNSLEGYIKHHGHYYLRRTTGEHAGNVNINTLKAKLEDIMIEGISQEVSQERPKGKDERS